MKLLKLMMAFSMVLFMVACGSDDSKANDDSKKKDEYSAVVSCEMSGMEYSYEFDSKGIVGMEVAGEKVDLSDYGYENIDLAGMSVEEYVDTFVEALESAGQTCEVK